MKCSACAVEMQKNADGYVCPQCGATIASFEKSPANRRLGLFMFIGCVVGAIFMWTAADEYEFAILGIRIPFALQCIAGILVLGALAGLAALFGKISVKD